MREQTIEVVEPYISGAAKADVAQMHRLNARLAPLWMLALPFIGALGAWLSLRAGDSSRPR